ncbi:hypothetical protein EKD02_09900, partial [Chlorobium phaeovibrioides]
SVQFLGEGDSTTDTITVETLDGTTQTISITINGTNDIPEITGIGMGSVTEDVSVEQPAGILKTTGDLDAVDVDTGESGFVLETVSGTYGVVDMYNSGWWRYRVDNSQSAIQELGEGDTLTDTITVRTFDGTEHDITITINGTNDAPTITGTTTGTVQEDVIATASGVLAAVDVDAGESGFAAATFVGTYGSLTIDGTGNWTYTLDDSSVQFLGEGDSTTDT